MNPLTLLLKALTILPRPVRKPVYFALLGGAGCLVAALPAEVWHTHLFKLSDSLSIAGSADDTTTLANTGWLTVLTVGLGLTLIVGQNAYLGRALMGVRQFERGALAALSAAVVAGIVAEMLFLRAVSYGRAHPNYYQLALYTAWPIACGIAGALCATGISLVVPNLRMVRAAIGGLAGGLLGWVPFYLMQLHAAGVDSYATRFAGASAIGAMVGLMVAIADQAFTAAWLEVVWGPRDVRLVPLGKRPVRVGSNWERSSVYAPGAPPELYRYRFEAGRVTLEDVPTGRKLELRSGDERSVNKLVLRARIKNAAAVGAGVAAATIPAAPPSSSRPIASPSGATAPAVCWLRTGAGQTIEIRSGRPLTVADLPGSAAAAGLSVAEVQRHPTDPARVGLRNLGGAAVWQVTKSDGVSRAIQPGQTVLLETSLCMRIGREEFVVV